jgi:hypothetical protein
MRYKLGDPQPDEHKYRAKKWYQLQEVINDVASNIREGGILCPDDDVSTAKSIIMSEIGTDVWRIIGDIVLSKLRD